MPWTAATEAREQMMAKFRSLGRAPSHPDPTTNGSDPSNAALDNGQNIESMVCKACWDGLFSLDCFQKTWCAIDTFYGQSYGTTWKQLTQSAGVGCHWCAQLVAAIKKEARKGRLHSQDTFEVTIGPSIVQEESGQVLGRKIVNVVIKGRVQVTAEYEVYAAPDDIAAKYIKARARVWQVSSPASFKQASEWLEECAHEHELCSKLLTPHSTLPTRVIDCSDPERPKLYISSGSRGAYAALSYVWGGEQKHSVRTNTLDAYIRGIELERLPQTIIDTIITTNRLGVRYLWVDSLCILQDSNEDKSRELAQMRRVYRDAYVTIIAAAAKSATEGFLRDRPAPPANVPLPFRCPDGQIGVMSLSPRLHLFGDPPEVVDTRGWCFQEWLLSPRALVFASRTLQYQCHTLCIDAERRKIQLPSPLLLPSPPTSLSTEDALLSWRRIVQEYTKRSVTYPSDKLVALSGIAEVFGRVWSTGTLGSTYLAGLWRNDYLHTELLWQSRSPRQCRPAKYRAPSWSWAAIDGQIHCPESPLTEPACEIIRCELTVASEIQPFGEITGGILQLKATPRRIFWNPAEEYVALDVTVSDSESTSKATQSVRVGQAYPDCDEDVSNTPGPVWAIPVATYSDRYRKPQNMDGLVVVQVPQSGKNPCFRRVGVFRFWSSALRDTDLNDIVKAWLATPGQEVTIL